MRKLLLLPFLIAVVFLTACAGGGGSLPAACPTPDPSASLQLPSPPAIDADELSLTVWRASRILEEGYVDTLNRLKLLEAAWQGTVDELLKRGISVPADIDPNRSKASVSRERETQLRTAFERVLDATGGKLSAQQVVDIALAAMAASLNDGHTYYVPPRAWDDETNRRVTSFGFSGVPHDDGFLLTDVLEASPADRAGLRRGDFLTFVNGQPYASDRPSDFAASSGATTLSFSRSGAPAVEVSLQREATRLPMEKHELLDGQIGLIRLYDFPFSDDCDYIADFQKATDGAIDDLKRQGAKAWAIDLRYNPGGSVLSASFFAGTLGYDGPLIEIIRGGDRTPIETTSSSILGGAPLAILINQDSASSSEIVADVMKDARAAHVVGTKSAGEVAAARPYPIAGGALMVTVGRVGVGPTHRSLQGVGVKPDTAVQLDLGLLAREGRDSQVEAAVEYLKTRLR
jgi:carboxyl-terminal processing protease